MNLQNLIAMAKSMGIGQDKISQAQNMMSKYSTDINGLRQAINDNGGVPALERVLKFANSPIAKIGLSKIGVTPEVIESLKKDLGIAPKSNPNNNIFDRFKNLK